MNNERSIMKAVGILISELYSEYEGTRRIAIAQLILLGDKIVPFLSAARATGLAKHLEQGAKGETSQIRMQ